MIKFSDGQTVETLSIRAKDELWGDAERQTAVITTTGISVTEAVKLFIDGAVWSVVEDGVEDKSWNAFTKAGPLTDNRDGTLTVRMGVPDTKETELEETLSIILGEEV